MTRKLTRTVIAVAIVGAALVAVAPSSSASRIVARVRLIDDSGARVGGGRFMALRDGRVQAHIEVMLPTDSSEAHGMHIHANDPATGCLPGTGFTGVGGHWDVSGQTHGGHTGDLPSILRQSTGRAQITFTLDKFQVEQVLGRALIVHLGPDNFGNVPLGEAENQYTDNGTAYTGVGGTASTGNAGSRYACGVITN